MENKFTIKELENEDLIVFEKRKNFPKVFITKSKEWNLYLIKEFCITKNKRSAIKAACNTLKLIKNKEF